MKTTVNNRRSSVSIGGKALMVTRLFDSKKPGYEPPVITVFSESIYLKPCTNFLSKGDRELITDMYEYAHNGGQTCTVSMPWP
jgi:hypothetical protein